MEKIADKKNGVTTEDASAFITGVELFFLLLIVEFVVVRSLPFKVSLVVLLGVMAILWYITHYNMRKVYRKKILKLKVRNAYYGLSKSKQKRYFGLSIIIFFTIFFIFFIASVIMIGGYSKQ